MDFPDPLEGKMYLIAVDAFSKQPEVVIIDTTTSSKTIDALRDMFAHWGLPHRLVTDNGPQFTSVEFEKFIKSNPVWCTHPKCTLPPKQPTGLLRDLCNPSNKHCIFRKRVTFFESQSDHLSLSMLHMPQQRLPQLNS